jgi:bifunctional non-homologous end joining protein LigD
MSVTSELRRRVSAEQPLPRYEPCLPRSAKQPPAGPGWIHEIKHDGFRIMAYRNGDSVRLMTRKGYDFADRFPLIVDAVAALPARSCVIDGEAIACDDNGLSVFDLLHYQRRDQVVTLCAFDLLSINGEDVRSEHIEDRKHRLCVRQEHGGSIPLPAD